MKPLRLLTCLGFVLTAAACGGGSGDPTASGGAAASSGSSAASSSSPKVVPHEKLAELLPKVTGFKRDSDVTGTTDTAENVSRVQLDYIQEGGGIAGLSVEMMDVAGNSAMLAPLKESLGTQGTKKTITGTQKATTIAGYPASEEWTPEAGNGVVSVLVADRFVVTITGSGVGKVDVIYKAFDAIDLKKIAALK